MRVLKINGVPIKNPSTFGVEHYTLTKSTRVANGDMVMDYVANKLKFNFSYNAIESRELNQIIDLLWGSLATTRNCFCAFEYQDGGVTKTATVYAGAIPRKLHRGDGSSWVWKDVQISLIEK